MPLSPMDGRNTVFCELQCDTLSRSIPLCHGLYVCTSALQFSAEKTLRLDRPHPTTPDNPRSPRLASPHLALSIQKILVATWFPRSLYSALRDDIRSVGLFSFLILWRLVVRWWQQRSIECTEFSSGLSGAISHMLIGVQWPTQILFPLEPNGPLFRVWY